MNTFTLVHKLMDFIKFRTNIEKDYSVENINRIFKDFCNTHQVTCNQTLVVKYTRGVSRHLATNDGKPLTFYKNNIILP